MRDTGCWLKNDGRRPDRLRSKLIQIDCNFHCQIILKDIKKIFLKNISGSYWQFSFHYFVISLLLFHFYI